MCIINHIKISSQNLVIYHTKMTARHSTPMDFFTKNSVRFSYFLLLTLRTMPWRRSLGQALGRVSIFLVQKIETGASQNESHHHFEMSIISVIYHNEKIIIPLEKRTDFEMTLEIIIIIISKRKSYLILAEGQHDGTSPAYTWSMLQASLLQERNTIYRYNGSVHR